MNKIAITAYGSISALGTSPDEVWEGYLTEVTAIRYCSSCSNWVSKISAEIEEKLQAIQQTNKHYKGLDRSVLLAVVAAANAVKEKKLNRRCGVNFGSSRGATTLFENYFKDFSSAPSGKLSPRSSPNTTLGNIASNVANYLGLKGLSMSHSITCSTALHSVLNGIAWLNSGMVDQFLAGGAEAPLTAFTIAQMKALHLYSSEKSAHPCRAMDLAKAKNTMVLGEGAACFLMERKPSQKALAYIEGCGFATEKIKHGSSISEDAKCMQEAMKMALIDTDRSSVDAVILHSPGTIAGDRSEWNAIQKVFGKNIPFLTTNKWKIGHTLGASGALSLELALLMLTQEKYIGMPFFDQTKPRSKPKKILVNAVGFGGNAVSILLSI